MWLYLFCWFHSKSKTRVNIFLLHVFDGLVLHNQAFECILCFKGVNVTFAEKQMQHMRGCVDHKSDTYLSHENLYYSKIYMEMTSYMQLKHNVSIVV